MAAVRQRLLAVSLISANLYRLNLRLSIRHLFLWLQRRLRNLRLALRLVDRQLQVYRLNLPAMAVVVVATLVVAVTLAVTPAVVVIKVVIARFTVQFALVALAVAPASSFPLPGQSHPHRHQRRHRNAQSSSTMPP